MMIFDVLIIGKKIKNKFTRFYFNYYKINIILIILFSKYDLWDRRNNKSQNKKSYKICIYMRII